MLLTLRFPTKSLWTTPNEGEEPLDYPKSSFLDRMDVLSFIFMVPTNRTINVNLGKFNIVNFTMLKAKYINSIIRTAVYKNP